MTLFSVLLPLSAYIECSALEKRGLRHIVEEAVWILNSAVIASSEAALEAAETDAASNNGSRKWSLSASYPASKSSSLASNKARYASAFFKTKEIYSFEATCDVVSYVLCARAFYIINDVVCCA
jgi:hypothetical protein